MQELFKSGRFNRATVLTDASFCHKTKLAGWAAWMKVDKRNDGVSGAYRKAGQLREREDMDSSAAEVMAAANGCWLAANLGATSILLQSDCMAVIHLVSNRCKAPRLKLIWNEMKALPVMKGVHIQARHVKGHGEIVDGRTWVNDWCDRAARDELRAARRRNPHLFSTRKERGPHCPSL